MVARAGPRGPLKISKGSGHERTSSRAGAGWSTCPAHDGRRPGPGSVPGYNQRSTDRVGHWRSDRDPLPQGQRRSAPSPGECDQAAVDTRCRSGGQPDRGDLGGRGGPALHRVPGDVPCGVAADAARGGGPGGAGSTTLAGTVAPRRRGDPCRNIDGQGVDGPRRVREARRGQRNATLTLLIAATWRFLPTDDEPGSEHGNGQIVRSDPAPGVAAAGVDRPSRPTTGAGAGGHTITSASLAVSAVAMIGDRRWSGHGGRQLLVAGQPARMFAEEIEPEKSGPSSGVTSPQRLHPRP